MWKKVNKKQFDNFINQFSFVDIKVEKDFWNKGNSLVVRNIKYKDKIIASIHNWKRYWINILENQKEKVIYRVYRSGNKEVIALFPQYAVDTTGYNCQSYMHVGQHGDATPNIVISQTRLAKFNEYKDLHTELQQIGYNLRIVKKFTQQDFDIRQKQIVNITE